MFLRKVITAGMSLLFALSVVAAPIVKVTPADGTTLNFDDTLTIQVEVENASGGPLYGSLMTQPTNGKHMTVWSMNSFPFSITYSNMPSGTHSYRAAVTDGGDTMDVYFKVEVGPMPQPREGPFILRELGEQLYPTAINNRGDISGYLKRDGRRQAFIIQNRILKELPGLGGTESVVLDINNLGVAVGWALNEAGETVATTWDDSGIHAVPGITESPSKAAGLNDRGHIVGSIPGGGFVLKEGVLTQIVAPANAINNNGLICDEGYTLETEPQFLSPVAVQGGIMGGTPPEYAWRILYAVNDSGLCAGYGYKRPVKEFGHSEILYRTRSDFEVSPRTGADGYREALAVNKWNQWVGYEQIALFNYDPFEGEIGFYLLESKATFNGAELQGQVPGNSSLKLRRATGINDSVQIVGVGERDGKEFGFILEPALKLDVQLSTASLSLSFRGEPGEQVMVQKSADLAAWEDLGTIRSSESITESRSGIGQRRFYRAVRR